MGALGAALFGTKLLCDSPRVPCIGGLDKLFLITLGIGGGARGFSKLPSWFCGNLGLDGGEITEAGVPELAKVALIPKPEAGLRLVWPLLLL